MAELGIVTDRSCAYWSGRAGENSALHMESYNSAKRDAFAAQVALSLGTVERGAGEDRPLCVLDLGCGSGFMSLLLLDAGCEVTGVDFSVDMLAQAAENVAAKGYEGRAKFLQMEVQHLAFADDVFDAVVSRNVTWILEDVDRVYAEVFRVLKPGGVFLNLDANYGRAFAEAEARGETPTHRTQTLEQLLERNDIVRDLAISHVDRPGWDVQQFWQLGAREIRVRRAGEGTNVSAATMFALEVRK